MRSILVLYDIRDAAQKRVAILDHLHALDHAPADRVRVTYVNMAEVTAIDPRWIEADAIVLHTTLLVWRWSPLFGQRLALLQWLQQYRGFIVAMPQDEYDHAHALDDWLVHLNAHVVVTCLDAASRPLLYPRMHTRALFVDGLTGYLNPERVAAARAGWQPPSSRTTDIVYRANQLPFWFGWLGQLKVRLGTESPARLAPTGLRTDISVRAEDTVLGEQWLGFLGSARGILGSESGSSVLDRRGEVGLHIRALLADQPALTFEQTDALAGGELTRFHFSAIGPRHLEAAMLGTVQLLVEGAYSGIFRPWDHYIPVARDLSDLAEKALLLRDDALVDRMAEQAYEDIVTSQRFSYAGFAGQLLDTLELFFQAAGR